VYHGTDASNKEWQWPILQYFSSAMTVDYKQIRIISENKKQLGYSVV
jgi:hypothetical protein